MRPSLSSLSLIITLALLVTVLAPTGAAAVKLDEQYNKNGEVYVLLRGSSSGPGYARPGIYKTCEYQVDDTGQRTVLVASPANIDNVLVTRGQAFNTDNYGIAVNKDRVCYTFTNEVSDKWEVGGPEWKKKVAASWITNGACLNGHFGRGHGRGYFTGQPAWFKVSVGNTLAVTGTLDAAGDFTGVSGTTVTFPCGINDRGWTTGPWPDPVGPWTPGPAGSKKSNSDWYMMPMGMSYHDWADSRRNHGLPYVFLTMGALKPTNLRMHHWKPLAAFTPWSKAAQSMPPYEDVKLPDVVFKLFEAKYRVFITTPCGDACRSGSAGGTAPAGTSTISVTITPFGRAYGLQVVKTPDSEMISIKRYDPGKAPIEYTPLNWTTVNPPLHLKTIRTKPGGSLSPTAWGDAKKIATSYKYSPTEAVGDPNTKQEFVYISDSDYFCVADTWFGDGGRAFFGKNITEGGRPGVLLTSQTRDEVKNKTEEKYFKVFRKVQDIAADGYGNLFVMCTTGLPEIQDLMDKNGTDFDKLKTVLTKPDEWGYSIVDGTSYTDSGWYTNSDRTRTFRDISFNLIVYKTILKINSNYIDEKGTKTEGGAPDLLAVTTPVVVGQLKVGTVPCERRAERSGTRIFWTGPLSSSAITEFPAELAAINIAAPPEEQGVNYYIDIKGPTNNTAAAGQKDRASKSTDTVYEGETGTWSMENGPEFDAIYGLNINNGTSLDDDENKNGTVGSLRNNVIKESLVAHWKVYRLYDIERLALPDPPLENETLAQQTAAGKYSENLLFEKTLIFSGTQGYNRKKGGTNQTVYGGRPGFAAVNDPFTLTHQFKEAGIYKICLSVDFDYYEYWKLEFGSNRGARDNVKQSSDDLSVPTFFKAKPGFPVFNHKNDTRFVVVLARDAVADDDHIRKVKVTAMKPGSENPVPYIEVPEVDRSRDVSRPEIPGGLYREKVDDRIAMLTDEEVDKQRMTEYDIVGDFCIRFASALPGIGDTSNTVGEREAKEKFGGIGVYDYSPDEVWNYGAPVGRDEVNGGPLKAAAGVNAMHPPNWKSGTDEADATTFQVFKYDDVTKDRLALVKRNYGMSGHGTLVRALSQAKLDAMQVGMSPTDKAFLKRHAVPNSQWNANDGENYPIREIDWDNVRYQWTIDYKVNGTAVHEEPASYGGTVGELLRAYWNAKKGFDSHGFIARLGTKNYPDPSVTQNGRNVFNEGSANPVDIDAQKIPAFHVRIPMLELDPKTKTYKPIRWETPIAPETYKIGLRVWAPALRWQQDKSFKITADKTNPTTGAVEATFKDKQVYWDLVNDRINTAKCDPLNNTSLKGVDVWVIDREPPRFKRTGTGRTNAAMFSFTGGTTGDKYTAKDVVFTLVENNPNISIAGKQYAFQTQITGGKFNPDDGFAIDFPLNLTGGSTHATERHMFKQKDGDYAIQDNSPGRCFDFELSATKEFYGAPYAEGGFILPVCADGRSGAQVKADDLVSYANDAAANNATVDPSNKNKDSTPFMPPDYIGNLPYQINFQIPAKLLSDLKAAPEAGKLVIPAEYTPGMFFQVVDNDPPMVFVDITTSFTDIDKFGFAVFDDEPGKFKYDFATRNFELNNYLSRLNGNDPATWPSALVDAIYAPGNVFDYGDSWITWKSDKEDKRKFAAGPIDDRTVEVSTVKVFIPEKSRAVFEIRAVDNVPRGGSYVVDLGTDNFAWDMKLANSQSDNERFERDITTAEHVTDPKVMNLFGIFRLPTNTASESNILKIRVADEAFGSANANQSEVHVHVNVINTFLKQEKLDMENRRVD